MRRRSSLVLPAVSTAVMLAMTLGLGVWQLQRLAWKRELLAQIDSSEASPPTPLRDGAKPFRRVVARGVFQPQTARYGVELRQVAGLGPVLGSQVLSALVPSSGLPVLVDLGWAPEDDASLPPKGEVQVEGYVRPSEPASWLTPKDDLPRRHFYALDPRVIAEALGVARIEPFTLVAIGPSTTTPFPALALPRPPNDHLSYALTWFALSAALAVIFALYVRAAGKKANSA